MKRTIINELVCFLSVCLTALVSLSGVFAAAADEKTVIVNIFDRSYSGILDGSDTFTYVGTEEDAGFTLTCEWKNVTPKGEAQIVYADGTTVEGTFKNGKLSGPVTRTFPDGSYETFSCTEGFPTGLITACDAGGTAASYDCYYQGLAISALVENSNPPSYYDLFKPGYYNISPVLISGTVEGILDSQTEEKLIVKDEDAHYYILTYANTAASDHPFNQGIIPSFRLHEQIQAWGYYQETKDFDLKPSKDSSKYTSKPVYGFRRLSNDRSSVSMSGVDVLTNQLSETLSDQNEEAGSSSSEDNALGLYQNNTLPVFQIIYAEKKNAPPPDRSSLAYTYEEIQDYPYIYYGMDVSVTGSVTQSSFNYKEEMAYFTLKEDKTGDLYMSMFDFSKASVFPVVGDHIVLKGTYNGIAKMLNSTTKADVTELVYILYPCLLAKEISVS